MPQLPKIGGLRPHVTTTPLPHLVVEQEFSQCLISVGNRWAYGLSIRPHTWALVPAKHGHLS